MAGTRAANYAASVACSATAVAIAALCMSCVVWRPRTDCSNRQYRTRMVWGATMALRAWFGRSKGLFRANRRRGAADDVTTYFRACAIRLMLREFAARSVAQGDVLDLSAEWMRLSVKTTLRQSDFAAATGVLVKRLCLRHHLRVLSETLCARVGAQYACLRQHLRVMGRCSQREL